MSKSLESLIEGQVRGFWWILAACALFAVGILYMEWRLDNRLRYRAPTAADVPAIIPSKAEPIIRFHRQTVYVPAYSHVYHQGGRPLLLTVTLIVRNTDRDHEVMLSSVRYYDSSGKEIKSHLDRPLRLKPLASAEFLIERKDTSGGSGASFMVEWAAKEKVTEPVIETVMIDTEQRQGISLARRGIVVANSYIDDETR